MADAAWFSTHDEALQATCPEGTSGAPIQVHPDASGT